MLARLAGSGTHYGMPLKDKIFYISGNIFLVVITYILPFGDWLNAHGDKGASFFCELTAIPWLDHAIYVALGVTWTYVVTRSIANIIAILVDLFVIDDE